MIAGGPVHWRGCTSCRVLCILLFSRTITLAAGLTCLSCMAPTVRKGMPEALLSPSFAVSFVHADDGDNAVAEVGRAGKRQQRSNPKVISPITIKLPVSW